MPDPIRITTCRVFLNQAEDDHLKAFASIILNESFAVCDLKIIQGGKGLFVAMPSRRRRDGTFHDVAHPINHALREHIEQVVLREYEAVLEQNRLNPQRPQVSAREGVDDKYFDYPAYEEDTSAKK